MKVIHVCLSGLICVCLFLSGCAERSGSAVSVSPAFAVADSLRIEGRAAEAGAKYAALRDSFALARDTASWWRAQLWLADALLKEGHRDSAEAALANAVTLSSGNADRIGWTRYIHSIFLDRVGHFDSALVEASAAQNVARKVGDRPLEASSYSAMGRIHSLSGRYAAALENNQRAIALERSYGATPREISKEMNELGIDYRHLGRFTDAVAIYDSALDIARRLKNPESIARVEFNLGEIRRETGDGDEALALFSDALTRAEQIGEVRGMAFVHGGLAELYAKAGENTETRRHLEKALELNRGAKLVYGQLQNLEALGRLDVKEARISAADSALRTALSIADSAHYGKERSTVRAALARSAAARNRGHAALRWAEEAVHIADSLGDPEPEEEAHTARGIALEVMYDSRAQRAYLDGVNLLESWRGRLALGDLRMGVAEPYVEIYEGAIRTLLAAKKAGAALEMAERARARLLLELMAERNGRADGRTRDQELRQKLKELFSQRAQAKENEAAAIDREIGVLTTSVDSIEIEARARDTRFGVRYPLPASLADLQSGLLQKDDGLIVFFWGEQSVYGWWITRSEIRSARLGSTDTLAATLDFLRGAIKRDGNGTDWKPSAHRAYNELIRPLSPGPVAQLLVVADGPLATIPLETLIPPGTELPLGATTKFVYGPSASVLLSLARARPSRSWQKGVLAVGNPTIGEHSGGASSGENRGSLSDLPEAAGEARSVAKLLGGDVLVGTDATLTRWLSLDPERYRYLHFATHAVLNDRHPEQTSLILARGSLNLAGIRRLRLTSDLVTLSACETGLGQRLRGEGIIGLPHAFLSAGAHSVIVSLWRVEDRATASYMRDFYEQLRAGRTPPEAMLAVRQARLRSTGSLSHPSQWAPFILVGLPAKTTD